MKATDDYYDEIARYQNNDPCGHFILNSKNGDHLSLKGNGYSVIGENSAYKIHEGIYLFKTNAVFKDVDLRGWMAYPDDALVIYKVKKGRWLFVTDSGREGVLGAGDILSAAGNFKLLKLNSFDEIVEYFGVAYYYKEMLEAIHSQSLNQSFLEDFYNSDLLRNILIHRGNQRINRVFDELESALDEDNKILMKAKSLELLSESALFHKEFIDVEDTTWSEEKRRLFREIKDFLDTHLEHYYSMQYIADHFSISLSGLKNLFREAYGISPYCYHLNKRLEKAAQLLAETEYKITYIHSQVGFNHHSNFSKAFQEKYHCSPSQYREKRK